MIRKILLTALIMISMSSAVMAESLFTLGASQTYAPAPKSLYGGVQARTVGDLISIIMDESVRISDNLAYNTARESKTVDNFSKFINSFLGHDVINKDLNNFGGSNKVTSTAGGERQMAFGDKIAVQVVQQMPNGNLVVQGKKTIVHANERMNLMVTGIVDPRWINSFGQVYSRNVANLQFALSSTGSISRSNSEGLINRVIRYLF